MVDRNRYYEHAACDDDGESYLSTDRANTVPGGYAARGIIAPGGYITKGPQGITFVGTAYSEPSLIGIAYGFEQATKHRIQPVLS